MSKLKSLLIPLILILVSVGISLLGLELYLRATNSWKQVEGRWLLPSFYPNFYWKKDKDLIFTTTHVEERIRQLATKKDDQFRVVLIGDSFTQGDPQPENFSYDRFIKKHLLLENREADVINLGVGGFGPDQELMLLQKAMESSPRVDVVVWQFFNNDIFENYTQSLFEIADNNLVQKSAEENWLYKRQDFYDQIPLPDKVKYESYLVNWLLYFFEKENYEQPADGYEQYYKFTLDKIDLAINRAQKLAKQKGFKLYLALVVPQAAYANDNDEASKYTLVDYLKLREVLIKKENFVEIKIEDTEFPQHKYFSREGQDPLPFGTRHFNEVGYEFMAQKILGAITESTESATISSEKN